MTIFKRHLSVNMIYLGINLVTAIYTKNIPVQFYLRSHAALSYATLFHFTRKRMDLFLNRYLLRLRTQLPLNLNQLSEELWGHTRLTYRAPRGISSVRTRFLVSLRPDVKQLLEAPQKLREPLNLIWLTLGGSYLVLFTFLR